MSSVFQGTRLTIGFWPGTSSPPLLRHPSTKPSIADPGDSSTLNGSGPILPPPVFVMAHWVQLRLAALLRRPSGSTRSSRIYSTHTRRWPRSPATCDPRPTGGMTPSAVPRNVMPDGLSAATKRHFQQILHEGPHAYMATQVLYRPARSLHHVAFQRIAVLPRLSDVLQGRVCHTSPEEIDTTPLRAFQLPTNLKPIVPVEASRARRQYPADRVPVVGWPFAGPSIGLPKCHSTETALLKVVTDLTEAIDAGDHALLGLLDLSAAFDTVDHDVLAATLSKTYGIHSTALDWLRSYLCDRRQTILFDGVFSTVRYLCCGVPQGSVLGPLLFLLYTADLGELAASLGLSSHFYADDSQLYTWGPPSTVAQQRRRMELGIERIAEWIRSNRLRLNPEKTDFLWCATRRRCMNLDTSELSVCGALIRPSTTVRNLGVLLESE